MYPLVLLESHPVVPCLASWNFPNLPGFCRSWCRMVVSMRIHFFCCKVFNGHSTSFQDDFRNPRCGGWTNPAEIYMFVKLDSISPNIAAKIREDDDFWQINVFLSLSLKHTKQMSILPKDTSCINGSRRFRNISLNNNWSQASWIKYWVFPKIMVPPNHPFQ